MTEATVMDVWDDPEHDDWSGLASRMRHLVNEVSGRRDLAVRFAPQVGQSGELLDGAGLVTASFVPALARVRFTAQRLLIPDVDDPATIDPLSRRDMEDFADVIGVAMHEAGHAGHTDLAIPAGTGKRVAAWVMILEEPRMEGSLVLAHPEARRWLQISAREMAASNTALRFRAPQDVSVVESGFRAFVLMGGRWLAGVFSQADVRLLRQDVAAVISDDALAELERIVGSAVALPDGDSAGLIAASRELLDLMDAVEQEQEQEQEDGADYTTSAGQDADDGDGESGGDGQGTGTSPGTNSDGTANGNAQQMPCGSWTSGDLDDGLDPDQHSPTAEAGGELDANLEARAVTAASKAADAAEADSTSSKSEQPEPSQGVMEARAQEQAAQDQAAQAWQGACGTWATQITTVTVPASPKVQEQARALTRELRRAAYRAVTRSTIRSKTPPGRMRMGEEVHRRGQIAAHATPTATPYRQIRRRENQNPPLLVGFAGDVSGTMQPWQQVTAELGWAIAQTGKHLDATVAAVAWDASIRAIYRPGRIPAAVEVADCVGGSTGCPAAVAAVDAALNLSRTRGAARILVIVTDGGIGDSRADVITKVNRLADAGVRTLWVTPSPDHLCPAATNLVLGDPERFGKVVGAAIGKVLAAH